MNIKNEILIDAHKLSYKEGQLLENPVFLSFKNDMKSYNKSDLVEVYQAVLGEEFNVIKPLIDKIYLKENIDFNAEQMLKTKKPGFLKGILAGLGGIFKGFNLGSLMSYGYPIMMLVNMASGLFKKKQAASPELSKEEIEAQVRKEMEEKLKREQAAKGAQQTAS